MDFREKQAKNEHFYCVKTGDQQLVYGKNTKKTG